MVGGGGGRCGTAKEVTAGGSARLTPAAQGCHNTETHVWLVTKSMRHVVGGWVGGGGRGGQVLAGWLAGRAVREVSGRWVA